MPEPVRTLRKRIHPARIVAGVVTIAAFAVFVWAGWGVLQDNSSANEEAESHTTAAILCVVDECVRIRDDGVVAERALRPHGSLLLVLEDHTRDVIPESGEQFFTTETLSRIDGLRSTVSEHLPVRLGYAEVHDRQYEDFEFVTNEGWVLKARITIHPRVTAEILHRVLNEIGPAREHLSYIDIRIPDRVFFKMRE